ncbi:MAG: twin-arginine translocase subunit TatC [Cocleimonas sp.]
MSDSVANEVKTETVGILGHLIEMRDRLLRAVILIGVAFVCLFPFAKNIYNWLAAPLVNQGQEMLIIGPVAPFLIPMKLTLLVAFLIALPYLFYQLWSFVAPGLYKHEKRLIYPLIASSIFLFYLGIAFVYYILLPMMFKIIPQFAPEVAVFSPDIAMYLDFTIMMFIAFGIGFEMPIATILLISTGMTTAEDLKKKRPYVIVGAFIAGMLLTPPDVISQIMLAIPMWLLFELGLILSRVFNVRIKEASDARKDMDDSDTTTNTAAASAAAASNTPVLSADTLWEDDEYTYEDDDSLPDDGDYENRTNHNEYQDSDSFDMGTPDDKLESLTDDALSADGSDTDNFFDTEGFKELSDEEMDAELDEIEADELADEKVAKKKPAAKKKTSNKKSVTKKATPKKVVAKKAAPKKTTAKKTVVKKTGAKKSVAKKSPAKKPTSKPAKKVTTTKPTTKKSAAKKIPPKKKP